MLDEVSKFGYSHQIKFNPTKTSLLIYNPKKEDKLAKLVLCNEEIIRTNSVKYLGNELADNYSNKQHIEKRKTIANASLANLMSTGVINQQMNIQTKMRMFKTYLKPLLFYGIELADLNQGEISELKRIEGNTIKKLIGMTNSCRSEPLYGALEIETVEESVRILQYKFIKRIQTNQYLNSFLIETIKIQNDAGLVGNIMKRLELNGLISLDKLNKAIEKETEVLLKSKQDRSKFNKDAIAVKEILKLNNSYLRRKRLNEMLYYSAYDNRLNTVTV